jgi:hypothetical protein
MRDDGAILRTHDFHRPLSPPFRHGGKVGLIVGNDRAVLFDAQGEPTWAHEEKEVVDAISDGRFVYVLARGADERLVLKAFA